MLILIICSIALIGNNLPNVAGYSHSSLKDNEKIIANNLGVIGGEPVFKTRNWGWHAIIKFYNRTTKEFNYDEVYGGTLINDQWFVTAASVFNYVYYNYTTVDFKIDFGVNDRNETNPWSITNQAVEKIIVHPKWTSYGADYAGFYFSSKGFYNPFQYDIALVKLRKPIKLSDKIFAINLPSDDDNHDKSMESDSDSRESHTSKSKKESGWIVGFGQNGGWNASEYLEGVKLRILSDNNCVKAFKNYDSLYLKTYDFNSKIQICAGVNDAPKSYCAADIGGSLNVKNEQGDWTIKGIASAASIIYGNDVCNSNNFGTNYTGLFTRVAAFKPWILKTLKHND